MNVVNVTLISYKDFQMTTIGLASHTLLNATFYGLVCLGFCEHCIWNIAGVEWVQYKSFNDTKTCLYLIPFKLKFAQPLLLLWFIAVSQMLSIVLFISHLYDFYKQLKAASRSNTPYSSCFLHKDNPIK